MSLVELAERIAFDGDRCALKELHDNRVLCCWKDKGPLRPVEYIEVLSQGSLARRWCGYDDIVLDQAMNLAIDKFSNIPTEAASSHRPHGKGPDCRYYFRAFVDYATARLELEPPTHAIEIEIAAAEILRKLVKRHFYFSCLECRRRAQRLLRRYLWEVDGRGLYLWLPVEMPGRHCRKWLEANVRDVDPSHPGEQERVQGIVNRLLGRPRMLSIHAVHGAADCITAGMDPVASMIEEEISVSGLAGYIADEKAENVEQQRPAIRRLGRERLRQLVGEVFDGLVRGDYQADRIAGCFGLSKATFSRFAGSRWKGNGTKPARAAVPDLWRNTAQTLARHPAFVAAAKHAGVWKRVTEVLDAPDTGK
jgi:hypothetical protein